MTMKVILKQSVASLGAAGDVVNVKPGYARNYLLPQGIAYEATQGNLRRIEDEKAHREERSRRDMLEAKRRASQLEGIHLVFRARAGGEGDDARLFGSVTAAEIAEQLAAKNLGFELDRKAVHLDEPIKTLGVTKVPVHLHGDVVVEITVEVEREDG
jgi:large subunit ribosomal protein L9